MAKLLIKHPELRPYRIPFYDAVAARHNIRFLLNRAPRCEHFNHTVIGTTKSSMWRDGRSVKAFFREVALGDYDVLASSTPTASATIVAVVIAKMRRKKVILWTEQWRSDGSGWKGRVRRFLLGSMYRLADAHFATSTNTVKFIHQCTNVADSKIFFSPQCNRDLRQVVPDSVRLDIPEGMFVFLFVGRVIPVKGLDYLLRAFVHVQEEHPDAFLSVVGDGAELGHCKQLATELSLKNCAFHGAISDEDEARKAAYFAACDVLVFPSRIAGSHYEGWGLVVGEAMSMGKPVITTDAVGCANDMIEEGVNGYVVPHSSVEDLADAMIRIIEHRDKIPSMGKASREIFERQISYQRMSRAFLDAVEHVTGLIN